jgi:hypothetical protein
MPARDRVDQYANRALETVIMSAANTETFEQVRFGVGIFQGVALVIHRVEYHPTAGTLHEIIANADFFDMALTNRDDLTNLDPTNQNVIVHKGVHVRVVSAVGVISDHIPLISDFSTLPGGGLIIPANPLYVALDSAGFAAAGTCRFVIYYTFKQLKDADYIELVQGMLPANI